MTALLKMVSGVAAGSLAGQMTERGVNEFVEEEVCFIQSFGQGQVPLTTFTQVLGSFKSRITQRLQRTPTSRNSKDCWLYVQLCKELWM